ncbi:MAG: glycosyltransferase [Alphaproteobacteria bacterium]|nr:glycosyltransferase [Alphaproteobacteria bacterium]
MLVHNNGTRDGRVMREAETLQAAGHAVTVVGVPESSAEQSVERLQSGVVVLRVFWRHGWRRYLLMSGIPRGLVFLAGWTAVIYGFYRFGTWLAYEMIGALSGGAGVAWTLALLGALAVFLVGWGVSALSSRLSRDAQEREIARRRMIAADAKIAGPFPAIRSRIPQWVPDWALEIGLEPFAWFGAGGAKFSLYRYRSRKLAAAAATLKPDIIHCHDCIALPTGYRVKQMLGIPLIYDAHEIYEAVSARRLGATDYFARIHTQLLSRIDGFIAVNDSAARYYRLAYPDAPAAVVIRNATKHILLENYDGRLHRAAGVPPEKKILLYQGGFTKDRGLPTLVRSAVLLPADWCVVMMGAGFLADDLRAMANGVDAIRFLPPVPPQELLSWTQGATAGIVPYEDTVLNHWIATPNKLWEYPNAGVPMIVQPFPEMRRIVETYGCGWVLREEFSAAAIARLVASLSDSMIADARDGCRRFIAEDNWNQTYAPRLLELYRKLAQQAAAGRKPAPLCVRA